MIKDFKNVGTINSMLIIISIYKKYHQNHILIGYKMLKSQKIMFNS